MLPNIIVLERVSFSLDTEQKAGFTYTLCHPSPLSRSKNPISNAPALRTSTMPSIPGNIGIEPTITIALSIIRIGRTHSCRTSGAVEVESAVSGLKDGVDRCGVD
jgi:hypothetical protein